MLPVTVRSSPITDSMPIGVSSIVLPVMVVLMRSAPITPIPPVMVLFTIAVSSAYMNSIPDPPSWQKISLPSASTPDISYNLRPESTYGPNEESCTMIFADSYASTPWYAMSTVTLSTMTSRHPKRKIPSLMASGVMSRMIISVAFTQMTVPASEVASMISPDTPSR
ncbi:hypothetical protein MKMG_01289 [Methanogenium sp. MK-MG]|nr:hypothetical protein MKMG_01289 [Methanogenium sp. MK-MG]